MQSPSPVHGLPNSPQGDPASRLPASVPASVPASAPAPASAPPSAPGPASSPGPASALDPASTAHVEDLIDELKKSYTIVIVTHNMQQAARVSDCTAFFYQGRLIEMGSTTDLFTKPQQQQTEDYICGRFG